MQQDLIAKGMEMDDNLHNRKVVDAIAVPLSAKRSYCIFTIPHKIKGIVEETNSNASFCEIAPLNSCNGRCHES